MPEDIRPLAEAVKQEGARPAVSLTLPGGGLAEMVYRPNEDRTLFCVSEGETWRFEPEIVVRSQRLVPYSPHNNLLRHEVVLLPSEPAEYESEGALVAAIQAFIHRYVDVSPVFEQLASYYVLLSWVYDAFNELPYLRVRGDPGSGKTRFLLTVGSLCYKPIFASGASTVSPLFRILDAFQGTLVLDESDFRLSDERAEIVKILNNGNARGFPVLRSEVVGKREFDPRAYSVFGPKLIATRGFFEDRALESRCLTEELGLARLRDDIPISLPATWKDEARRLRNQLLRFRFRNRRAGQPTGDLVDAAIEPRLNQIFTPLLGLVRDDGARAALRTLARRLHRQAIADRGMDMEAQVLEIIRDLQGAAPHSPLSLRDITRWFVDRHGEEYDRKITTRWIGSVIRKKLRLEPYKSHGVFVIAVSDPAKLDRLYEKYGVGPREASDPEAEAPAGRAPDDPGRHGDMGTSGDRRPLSA
jgi:hypothetical protein